jgi:hypothetical protein
MLSKESPLPYLPLTLDVIQAAERVSGCVEGATALGMQYLMFEAPEKVCAHQDIPAQTALLSAQIEVMLPRDQHGDRPVKHQPYAKASQASALC